MPGQHGDALDLAMSQVPLRFGKVLCTSNDNKMKDVVCNLMFSRIPK